MFAVAIALFLDSGGRPPLPHPPRVISPSPAWSLRLERGRRSKFVL